MTTQFSNGVTNVRGKQGDTSLWSGIKQPLNTGGELEEVAYQDDFVQFSRATNGPWDLTGPTGSAYILAQYPMGWLRIGDAVPAAGEVNGLSSKEVWQYNSGKKLWFEARFSITSVANYNTFIGLALNGFVDPATVPTDCIGFSHLEDTTSIQFLSYKNGAGVSKTLPTTATAGYATETAYALSDSTVPAQAAGTFAMPNNSVRVGFLFEPAGSELGQTSAQYKIYLDGSLVSTQAASTVPDDEQMEVKIFTESKGTTANDLNVDYVRLIQQR